MLPSPSRSAAAVAVGPDPTTWSARSPNSPAPRLSCTVTLLERSLELIRSTSPSPSNVDCRHVSGARPAGVARRRAEGTAALVLERQDAVAGAVRPWPDRRRRPGRDRPLPWRAGNRLSRASPSGPTVRPPRCGKLRSPPPHPLATITSSCPSPSTSPSADQCGRPPDTVLDFNVKGTSPSSPLKSTTIRLPPALETTTSTSSSASRSPTSTAPTIVELP